MYKGNMQIDEAKKMKLTKYQLEKSKVMTNRHNAAAVAIRRDTVDV